MPHISIEYSANLGAQVDIQGLVNTLHQAALATGIFPLGGLRTRAARRDVYQIADGHPDNAFVHVVLNIGHGRDFDTRKRAFEDLFNCLTSCLSESFESIPLGISMTLSEIDPEFSLKKNNLHEYVKRRSET